jgi:hypothetical protein
MPELPKPNAQALENLEKIEAKFGKQQAASRKPQAASRKLQASSSRPGTRSLILNPMPITNDQ